MAETEEEERNSNNVITDTFIHPPGTTNTPRDKIDVENEGRISSDSLTEMIKELNKLAFDSKINYSADDHSNKNVAESNPKSGTFVATHTSARNGGKLIMTLPKEILHTHY